MQTIHPTAVVHKEAQIGENVVIGPQCQIGPEVIIGDNCTLHTSVLIEGRTKIGKGNTFHSFCMIGCPPQDRGFDGADTAVEIGDDNLFREFVTVHKATTKQDHVTKIGNKNFIMCQAHIGHDVVVGDNCTIVNACLLAGHVSVGSGTILSGASVISQFVRIGQGVFVEGATAINRDVFPYSICAGNRSRIKGINIVGLKRSGASREDLKGAMDLYKRMKESDQSVVSFVKDPNNIEPYQGNKIVQSQIEFILSSKVGINQLGDVN